MFADWPCRLSSVQLPIDCTVVGAMSPVTVANFGLGAVEAVHALQQPWRTGQLQSFGAAVLLFVRCLSTAGIMGAAGQLLRINEAGNGEAFDARQ